MKIWYVELSVGVGMTDNVVVAALDYEAACEDAYEECFQLADEYGYERNESHFGNRDDVGIDWDDGLDDYEDLGTLDTTVVPYDHEAHYDNLTPHWKKMLDGFLKGDY